MNITTRATQLIRPGTGESFIDTRALPGLFMIGLAVAAVPLSLSGEAYRMHMSAGWLALVALTLATSGVVWMVLAHRRLVRRSAHSTPTHSRDLIPPTTPLDETVGN